MIDSTDLLRLDRLERRGDVHLKRAIELGCQWQARRAVRLIEAAHARSLDIVVRSVTTYSDHDR